MNCTGLIEDPRLSQLNDNGNYRIQFSPTDMCNYNCSYCESNHDEKLYDLSKDSYCDNMSSFIDGLDQPVDFVIQGNGEPTLHPLTPYMIERMCNHENVQTVSLTTNMSNPLDYIRDHVNKKFQLAASYHVDRADYDDYVSKVNSFITVGNTVSVCLMMVPTKFQELIEIYERLRVDCKGAIMWPTLMEYKPHKYTEVYSKAQQDWFYSTANNDDTIKVKHFLNGEEYNFYEFAFKELSKFKGWKCFRARRSVLVDKMGNISRYCNQSENLGNIFFKNYKLTNHDIVCTNSDCGCIHLKLKRKEF